MIVYLLGIFLIARRDEVKQKQVQKFLKLKESFPLTEATNTAVSELPWTWGNEVETLHTCRTAGIISPGTG